MMLIDWIIFLRVLIVVLSVEIAPRYFFWWQKTSRAPDLPFPDRRTSGDRPLLATLMLGIAAVHTGIAALIFNMIFDLRDLTTEIPHDIGALISNVTIVAGSMLHLVPCWQISCGYHTRQVWISVVARFIVAWILYTGLQYARLSIWGTLS